MAKVNKLNSNAILGAYSKEFTQRKIILDVDGKNFEFLVDEKFKPSKVQALVSESLINFQKLKGYDESKRLKYYMFLIIKHFTDIEISDDFEDQIRLLNAMIDLEIFEKIIDAFPEEEFVKCSDAIKQFGVRANKMLQDEKSMQEIKETIEDEFTEETV